MGQRNVAGTVRNERGAMLALIRIAAAEDPARQRAYLYATIQTLRGALVE